MISFSKKTSQIKLLIIFISFCSLCLFVNKADAQNMVPNKFKNKLTTDWKKQVLLLFDDNKLISVPWNATKNQVVKFALNELKKCIPNQNLNVTLSKYSPSERLSALFVSDDETEAPPTYENEEVLNHSYDTSRISIYTNEPGYYSYEVTFYGNKIYSIDCHFSTSIVDLANPLKKQFVNICESSFDNKFIKTEKTNETNKIEKEWNSVIEKRNFKIRFYFNSTLKFSKDVFFYLTYFQDYLQEN